jgi:hypothetical protein
MNPARIRKDLEHAKRSGKRKAYDFGWFDRLHAFKVKRQDPTWPWATLNEMIADITHEVNTMKMYNILPQGAGSAIAAAAKAQRAADLVAKVQREVAEKKEAFERSMLKCIDDYSETDPRKALKLIELYLSKYPQSCVLVQVQEAKAKMIAWLEWKKVEAETVARIGVNRTLTRQGLVHVDRLPSSWSRA